MYSITKVVAFGAVAAVTSEYCWTRSPGVADETLLKVCRRDERMLITFDVGSGTFALTHPAATTGWCFCA